MERNNNAGPSRPKLGGLPTHTYGDGMSKTEVTTTATTEREFDWLDERWLCGTPDDRCRYCGLPQIFPPASLGIEVCRCNDAISESRTSALTVRFCHTESFRVRIHVRRISPKASTRNFQSTFSGRIPFARNGNPCQRVCEASPRAHYGGHHAAMLRPRRFNFSPVSAPAGMNPQKTRSA
jgi:hypothetical protein